MDVCCSFLFGEFRSFRSNRTIAGPGGVIGPLLGPNEGGRTTGKKQPKGQEDIDGCVKFHPSAHSSDAAALRRLSQQPTSEGPRK